MFVPIFFLREILCKLLILEAWIVIFGKYFMENARFGSLDSYFFHFGSFDLLFLVKVVSTKSIQQECQEKNQIKISSKSV